MRTLFRLLRRVLNWFLRINPKHTVAMLPVNFLRFFKRPPKKSPPPTNQTDVYYDGDADEMVRQDADGTTQTLGTSAAKWGNISGTLTDQTDLQAALDGKLSLSGGTMTGTLNFGNRSILFGVEGGIRFGDDEFLIDVSGGSEATLASSLPLKLSGANRASNIASVSTGTDAAYETAINAIIAALESHGIAATS